MQRPIRSVEDVLSLLDALTPTAADRASAGAAPWWDRFYADRNKPTPFTAKPDENLAEAVERGVIQRGRALDLGCGAGRNAVYLAGHGFDVTAVDLSPVAVAWARERADAAGARVRFLTADAFAVSADELGGAFELICDSGCFHHLAPHRRVNYRSLVARALAVGGHLSLTCFAAGAMGSHAPDLDFYTRPTPGGLGYTAESLRWIFADLTEVEQRLMREQPPDSPRFGAAFLRAALFRRDTPPRVDA